MSAPGYLAPGQPPRDPTAVMGARCVAWVVDALLFLGLLLLLFPPFSPLAEKADVPEGMDWEEACNERLAESEDAATCLILGDTAYWTDADDAVIQFVAELGWFIVIHVIWQGVSGATPGKLLLGLRVVREDGRPPGVGKALVRSLLWIVDGIPGFPLVGFVLAASSTGHRRVGDMAAKTFVVRKADAGRPVQVPGLTPSYGAPPPGVGVGAPGYASPGQGMASWGTPSGSGSGPGAAWPTSPPTAPSGPPTAPAPPTTPGGTPSWGAGAAESSSWGTTPSWGGASTGAPANTDETPAASPSPAGGMPSQDPTRVQPATPATPSGSEPTSGEQQGATAGSPASAQAPSGGEQGERPAAPTSATAASGDQPAASAAAPSGETPATTPSTPSGDQPATAPQATAAGGQAYSPQWDAARRAYIQWDPNRGRWLQWDDTAKEWKVI